MFKQALNFINKLFKISATPLHLRPLSSALHSEYFQTAKKVHFKNEFIQI